MSGVQGLESRVEEERNIQQDIQGAVMAGITRYEEIKAWQHARRLVGQIYRVSCTGRFSRDFGLRDQVQRAAVSSMSNIAEGFGRNSDNDFAHFLDISRGSSIEVQSLLYVALDLEYIGQQDFEALYKLSDETASLIGGFILYLRQHPQPRRSR